MKDRILQVLSEKGLTATRFADMIGVQRSSISHILSGRNKPSYDFIEKTLLKFPEIRAEWLILGKGRMTKQSDEEFADKTIGKNQKMVQNDLFSTVSPEQDTSNFNPAGQAEKNMANDKTSDVTYVNNSRIERIVIFYADKTFSEYKSQ